MATISIADSDARVQYTQAVTANSTQLTIDFPFFSLDDINVIVTSAAGSDTTLTRGTGTGTFAVTGTAVDDGFSGGNITLGDTYSDSSTKFTIFRDIAVVRTSDFPTSGPFNIAALNTELDKIFAIEQELETKIARTLKLTDSDSAASAILPTATTRANKYLAFDSSGDPTVLAGTSAPLSTVDSAQLVDGAVIASKMAADSVATSSLQNDSVSADKIADDAVGQDQIANNAVGTDQIADSAVTSAKLSSDAAFTAGMLMPYAGTSAPTGWLLAYGQEISRTTYASLYAAIGTTYGVGNGSSTFNLPDLRGRVIAGQDDMGGVSGNRLTNQTGGLDGDALGATGGSETHTLTTSQLAAHTHNISSMTVYGWSGGGGSGGGQSAAGLQYGTVSDASGTTSLQATTNATASSGGTGNHTASIANAGSDSPHNNVQPTIILNYIIKT